MKVITLKVSDGILRKLEILMDIEGESRSAIIRKAIEYYYIWRIHVEPKNIINKSMAYN